MQEIKVGFVCCSGFKRLHAFGGAFYRYFKGEKAGQVPHPYFITGVSTGAIASAVYLPWTEENFSKATRAIMKLKKKNIYSFSHWLELYGAMSLGESMLNFIPALHRDSQQTPHGRILLESGRTALSVAAKFWLFWKFLKQPSIFSSEPLRHLLKNSQSHLDFNGIWNSDIKLEIPAANLKTARTEYFTNYLPEHREAPNRNGLLVDWTMASSSMPAFLPAIQIGHRLLDDAALLDNLPLDRAIQAGCDVVFVLIFRPYLEKIFLRSDKINWTEELSRAMDLTIGRSTELTLERHQEINNDLKIIERLKEKVSKLYNREGRTTSEMNTLECMSYDISKLSAHGLKKTKIIPVWCEKSLPSLTFNNFNSESLQKAYELGYEAMDKTLAEINFK
ncbi:MAG: hypothetical protein A3C71_01975 [Candidatus Yanofskybacteria bacterium RIFCSPHIGHO2_02_FULL_43_15c]|uniref:PNPLA domain-containing protein n=1 Tax=Candidatus Yanofskybacteria bacterium RIFCSPHIGHO2_02_FULL_43_15c TaxID=1802679 RepID=A0A1F8FDS4_9BACT|nr:MAG: hypothetical protein A3C71_01975 [Candidatus Yanofskybacteria bacterium RIFCSPHIGHO2_02_FULL_43_15c]